MDKYIFSKVIGVVLGALTIIAALGYGFLYVLGTSLGRALQSEMDTSATDRRTLLILLSLIIAGIITGAGSFGLKQGFWRAVYFGFCLVVGTCFLVAFIISLGALGSTYEVMIVCVSFMFFLLGYLVIKEK